MSMDERVLASQKHEERLAAFWPRKMSRHTFTSGAREDADHGQPDDGALGLISALNSYTVYLALTGRPTSRSR
jgi:hypothetical protein